ncbi:MAG: FAD-linked oxidase C-terminal domain-containing protein [Microcella sp.]|uniref:FAD-binding oxidoreductase n=1 Tax=Microcella sp. TaxID=1913979 RepID=UPI0027201495|nr:FAD-linked oxidase C-terminal domain-containing protein [Microcella sp.]MDO8337095.1 FAD-linked oxidase C-terminal domain-containing protein [Microcella sp.]
MTEPTALGALRAALGDALSIDPTELEAARGDYSGLRRDGTPLAIVHARSITDVQAALRIATEHRLPVVPRGAGTGLTGGAMGGDGELVLSTARMTRILEVSSADQLAVVEPGVINAELNTALEPTGLFFAPDPASRAISTIGGNIATNAGGLLCAKYGVTREAVLGLKLVLADGTLLELGHRTVKGVTGLDLTALVIGSEGTLGVVVEATVRLVPLPAGSPATIGAYFPSVVDAATASAAITAAHLRPAVMELIDEVALARILAHLGLPERAPGSAYLLVQTDGSAALAEAERALAIIEDHGGEAALTTDADEGERMLAVRRAFHPAMAAAATVLIEDVAVPRSALPEMLAAIREIGLRHDLEIPTVAHAGDGNLHPNFLFAGDEVPPRVWEAAGELFRTAVRLGGTLTGEHGVGTLKRQWLEEELGAPQLDLQRRIKAVFDPLGIMNPGKVF